MRSLERPQDDNSQVLAAGEVFDTCVSMIRSTDLKARLNAIRDDVEISAHDYVAKAEVARLYEMVPHDRVGGVSRDEMVKLYTFRMVPKKSSGRPIYDRILSAPVNGRCPMCGIGTVSTLDHFLPKSHFPIFSVAPTNLVPVCSWCQKAKSEYFPTTEAEQLLHPYFDDMNADVWLAAEVVAVVPAAFRFFVAPPEDWAKSVKDRLAKHLKELNLQLLFASNAGSRLSEIRSRLRHLYENRGGQAAVRVHLREELTSIEAEYRNSWAAAMYRAAVDSDWFCDGGFLHT